MKRSPVVQPARGTAARVKAKLASRIGDRHNSLWLCAATAMMGVQQAGILTYLPVFLARLGATTEQIGLLTSLPAVASLFVLIPAGLFAERFPNQVRLRVRAAFLLRLPNLLLALVPSILPLSAIPSVAIFAWVLRALGMAVANSAWMTVMASAIPADQRPRVNGLRWALLSIVAAVLGAAFGRMLDVIAFPLNYQILFLISFAGTLLDLWLFSHIRVPLLKTSPGAPTRHGRLKSAIRSYVTSIKESHDFVRFLAATIGFRLALNMSMPLFSLYWVNELQASDGWIGLRGTAGYVALVIGYLGWSKIASHWPGRRVLLTAVLLYGLYPISTALVPSASWLPLPAVIWGIAGSGVDMGLFNLLLASAPKDKMPRLSSVLSLVSNGAAFLGPTLGVVLTDATNLRTALLVIGVLQILSVSTFGLLPRDESTAT